MINFLCVTYPEISKVYIVQTFAYNSILLTGLKFSCTVTDFSVCGTGSSKTSMLFEIVYKSL